MLISERLRSETLPTHVGSVRGSMGPGQMGITTQGQSVHTLKSFEKTDISVMLTDMSGLDPFCIARYVDGWEISLILMLIITFSHGKGILTKLVT